MEKHRWVFTLMVPTSTDNVLLRGTGGLSLGDVGTVDDLHATADKVSPSDLIDFYDVTTGWDFSGDKTHQAYVKLGSESPNDNDIGLWQIPVELWGLDS